MEFKIKERKDTVIHYGHRITVARFALFPTKIDNVKVWLEGYEAVLEWTKGAGHRTYNGYFHQSYADDWVEVKRIKIKKKSDSRPSPGAIIIFFQCLFSFVRKLLISTLLYRSRKITKDRKREITKALPKDWDRWTYRRVIRVRAKNAFYFQGQILKIKYFATFGAFDYKDRWVDYYDVGPEIKLNRWRRFWFTITKWI